MVDLWSYQQLRSGEETVQNKGMGQKLSRPKEGAVKMFVIVFG